MANNFIPLLQILWVHDMELASYHLFVTHTFFWGGGNLCTFGLVSNYRTIKYEAQTALVKDPVRTAQ